MLLWPLLTHCFKRLQSFGLLNFLAMSSNFQLTYINIYSCNCFSNTSFNWKWVWISGLVGTDGALSSSAGRSLSYSAGKWGGKDRFPGWCGSSPLTLHVSTTTGNCLDSSNFFLSWKRKTVKLWLVAKFTLQDVAGGFN